MELDDKEGQEISDEIVRKIAELKTFCFKSKTGKKP